MKPHKISKNTAPAPAVADGIIKLFITPCNVILRAGFLRRVRRATAVVRRRLRLVGATGLRFAARCDAVSMVRFRRLRRGLRVPPRLRLAAIIFRVAARCAAVLRFRERRRGFTNNVSLAIGLPSKPVTSR